ncbi:hypothetical protein GCM10010350_63060 [Streptomyces galilaeus]|nr:hypothetical protein GCM10010350_63060 [Streptomyces galilaeus]
MSLRAWPAVVLADDGEQAPQFGEGLAAAVADDAEGLGATFGLGGGERGGAVGEADDDGEGVAEDVVHLAGDAGTFLYDGEVGLAVALLAQRDDVGVGQPGEQPQQGEGHQTGHRHRAHDLRTGRELQLTALPEDDGPGDQVHGGHAPAPSSACCPSC